MPPDINNANKDKISVREAIEAIRRSGYPLESRIEGLLRTEYYYVEANTAYPDPQTSKSRELDIYALAAEKAGPGKYDYIFAVILLECVNNPQPMAFITKEPVSGYFHRDEIKLAGLPVKTPARGKGGNWQSLQDFLSMEKYHHYCHGRVATQFCSFSRKKQTAEWMASHDDEQFNSFSKLCSAVDHFVAQHYRNWHMTTREPVNIEFYYPVLILQGELLEARIDGQLTRLSKANHVQFRRSVFVGQRAHDYQVDVVTEKYFPRYLRLIREETSNTAKLLRRHHHKIRKAVDLITHRAFRLRSAEKRQEAMEFHG